MINPAQLRVNLTTALRAVPAVVALLGGDERNIVEYDESGDLYATIAKLRPPKILVVFAGTSPAGRRESHWRHSFSLVLRPSSDPAGLFTNIVNGMLNTEIHEDYHFMEIPSLQRRNIPIGETTFLDYWQIDTSFISKGVN